MIEKWLNYSFSSGVTTGEDFNIFFREIKKFIKKNLPSEIELVKMDKNHYYFSGFLKNKKNGKYIYFSVSDVRFFKDDWYYNVLVRTAKDENDYTGGCNNYCKITELGEKALQLSLLQFLNLPLRLPANLEGKIKNYE